MNELKNSGKCVNTSLKKSITPCLKLRVFINFSIQNYEKN